MTEEKWIESLTNYLQNIFPRNLNTDLLFFTSEPFRSTQDEATRTQVPPLLSLAFSPSLATMPHDSIWLTLCLNFCCSSKQEYILQPGSFRGGCWKISKGTRSCRSGKYYEQRYSSLSILFISPLNETATISFMIRNHDLSISGLRDTFVIYELLLFRNKQICISSVKYSYCWKYRHQKLLGVKTKIFRRKIKN